MNNLGQNSILSFAVIMQKKLEANAGKGGWEDCSFEYLVKRAKEELTEVENAITQNKSCHVVQKECADVANFMMMIADNYERE